VSVNEIGVVSLFDEVVMVVRARRAIPRLPEVLCVCILVVVSVFDRYPLLEAVLGKDLVAEVPLANVAGGVLVGREFGETRDRLVEGDVVGDTAGFVGVLAGHDRRPCSVQSGVLQYAFSKTIPDSANVSKFGVSMASFPYAPIVLKACWSVQSNKRLGGSLVVHYCWASRLFKSGLQPGRDSPM